MGCSRNWLSGNNCFGVLWTIFVEKFEQHSNVDLRWIIIVVKYFHIKFLHEISRMMMRAIERETNGKIWKIIFERSFEWSSEHWIDGNIRATENLLRITSYERSGWIDRSCVIVVHPRLSLHGGSLNRVAPLFGLSSRTSAALQTTIS